jgi:hypothetical protein
MIARAEVEGEDQASTAEMKYQWKTLVVDVSDKLAAWV